MPKAKRVNWKARAEELEKEIAPLRAKAAAFSELTRAVADEMREELREVIVEEIEELDIHIR